MTAWTFVVDEDIEPRVSEFLEKEGYDADHVEDIPELGPGTPDSEVMEYAKDHDAIIITSNWRDFTRVDLDRHAGVLAEFGHTHSAKEIVTAAINAAEHYQDPADWYGWNPVDEWLGV